MCAVIFAHSTFEIHAAISTFYIVFRVYLAYLFGFSSVVPTIYIVSSQFLNK